MSADEFTTDTGDIGFFSSLRYYTIVGIVDGQPYVMQMPKDVHQQVTNMWRNWDKAQKVIDANKVLAQQSKVEEFLKILGDIVIWPK